MRRLTASGRRTQIRDTGRRGGQSSRSERALGNRTEDVPRTSNAPGRHSRLAPLRKFEPAGGTGPLPATSARASECGTERTPRQAVFQRPGRFRNVEIQLVEDNPESAPRIRIGATGPGPGLHCPRCRPDRLREVASRQSACAASRRSRMRGNWRLPAPPASKRPTRPAFSTARSGGGRNPRGESETGGRRPGPTCGFSSTPESGSVRPVAMAARLGKLLVCCRDSRSGRPRCNIWRIERDLSPGQAVPGGLAQGSP